MVRVIPKQRRLAVTLAGIALLLAIFISPPPAQAAVQTCDLTGLKAAVLAGGSQALACSADTTITLDAPWNGTIATNLTLTNTGAGKLTISGNNLYQIFNVNSGKSLSLTNLNLTGGKGSDGGAIYNYGNVTISNSTLSGNSATSGYGGAIENLGNMTISNSTLSGNSATGGGAIENYNNGSVTISNSTLYSNSASQYGGGAIVNWSGTVTLTNSSLYSNSATIVGGAIYNTSGGTVNLQNSLLQGSNICYNTTGSSITDKGYNLEAEAAGNYSCGFSGTKGSIKTTDAKLGTPGNNGGATNTIALLSGSPAIDAIPAASCVVTADQRGVNRPQGTVGCDIGAYETTTGYATKLAFTTQPSGAVAGSAFTGQPAVTVQDANGNTVTSFSGAVTVAIKGGTGTTGATLSGTLTVNAVNGVATFSGLSLDKSGTSYMLTATSGTLTSADTSGFAVASTCSLAALKIIVSTGGTLDFNCAADTTITLDATWNGTIATDLTLTNTGAGKLTISGANTYQIFSVNLGKSLSLTNLNLTGGTATYGGAIYNAGGTSSVTITNSTLSGSSATTTGGAIYNNGGTVTITNSTLYSNSAKGGGAIENPFGMVTITNSTLYSNSATNGGAIYNNGTVTLTNSTLYSNSATLDGGAIDNTGGTVTLTNSTLYSNSANYGGAIYNFAGTANFQNSLLQGSSICAGGDFTDKGYNLVATTSIYNCQFSGTSKTTTDAILGTPGNNGGVTNTIALLSGSPAIDAIPAASCVVTADQRGVNRPQGTGCDIGAFETQVATKLAISTPSGAVAGSAFTTQPVITVQDIYSNTATSFSGTVTVAIKSGTGTPGATLGGTATISAVNGVATFSDLSLDKSGTGYVLTASATGLTSANTNSFDITTGTAAKLVITTQPSGAVASSAFTTQPVVTAQDANGNTATSFNRAVTVAIKSGAGTTGALLSGTLTVNAINGVATFSNLKINKSGRGYVLVFNATGLTSAQSNPFNVVIIGQPSDLIPQLRVSPSPVVAISPENLVSFSFKVKNIGVGSTSYVRLEIPIPQGLEVGYLKNTSSGVWVTQVTTTTVTIALPSLGQDQEVHGTLLFRPNANAVIGTEIEARYKVVFDDEVGCGKSLNSNTQRFVFGETNSSEDGAIQRGAAISATVGEKVSLVQKGYLANEIVSLWYTKPDGTSVSLGEQRANANGEITILLNTAGFAPGDYAVVGYGNRSEVTQVNILTVVAAS
ncbi:MAG: hypothetical protein HXX08_24870 [Chloroflexi bacterium]|uniref:CSLREA domain-containing protein n=1 Tax=Candidatus Chlorohelix allophototropha TaxID=3003348 RepID=A0A8T7MAR8_9CHLR|nr:hypothetical protein [Chloroflexota bacterium]